MDTIATEDLVQFAAEKLGKQVEEWPTGTGCYAIPVSGIYRRDGEEYPVQQFEEFDLSSWGLMGKGMAVCEHFITIEKGPHWGVTVGDQDTLRCSPDAIPIAFWTQWYQEEHTP